MEEITLQATIRTEIGKEAVKKLRAKGLIPAVVYKANKALNIKVAAQDFLKVIHTRAGENVVVNLQIQDEVKDTAKDSAHTHKKPKATKRKSQPTIMKEIQYHPVSGNVLHVDFNEISLTEALTVQVPIAAKGQAQGTKEGGVLEHVLWEVEVECLPTQIPEDIPVDVSALKIGDAILVKDLSVPSGVKILSDPEATVISLAPPHVEEEEVKPEEMVEPEVIMEKKPEEEEEAAEEAEGPPGKAAGKEPEK